jgi:hypothetical protein
MDSGIFADLVHIPLLKDVERISNTPPHFKDPVLLLKKSGPAGLFYFLKLLISC